MIYIKHSLLVSDNTYFKFWAAMSETITFLLWLSYILFAAFGEALEPQGVYRPWDNCIENITVHHKVQVKSWFL